MVLLRVRYCFISQWTKRLKHGLFVFPPKKTLIWRKHCSIGQSFCIMMSGWSIDWFLESSRAWSFFHLSVCLTNQKLRTFVSFDKPIKSVYFCSFVVLFCLHVLISRSYPAKIALIPHSTKLTSKSVHQKTWIDPSPPSKNQPHWSGNGTCKDFWQLCPPFCLLFFLT